MRRLDLEAHPVDFPAGTLVEVVWPCWPERLRRAIILRAERREVLGWPYVLLTVRLRRPFKMVRRSWREADPRDLVKMLCWEGKEEVDLRHWEVERL